MYSLIINASTPTSSWITWRIEATVVPIATKKFNTTY